MERAYSTVFLTVSKPMRGSPPKKSISIFLREPDFSITKSTTSKVLKLMEQNGLINRLDVEEDARLKKIVLTEKGYAINESVRNVLEDVEKKALEGFTQEETEQLFSFLGRIRENLKK